MLNTSNSLTKGCTGIVEPVGLPCAGSSRVQECTDSKENLLLETPLIIASKHGNLIEVRYLVEEAKVDVDQQCIFRSNNGFMQINGTALHAAVIAGQTEVVKYLLDCCKLDINATTNACFKNDFHGDFTALHLAVSCVGGNAQKEIITCLLAHGADWTAVDDSGHQCWEMTLDVQLTKLLINLGIGRGSSQNAKSSNIAHKWAGILDDRSAEIVALAIDKGVDINRPDVDGLTPMMIAAIGVNGRPNLTVFNVIFCQEVQLVSRLDRILSMELIGATLISSDLIEDGFKYLKKAMELRSTDGEIELQKTPRTDDTKISLNNTFEVQNMEELNKVADDPYQLKVQAHLIRLRILGLEHSETMRCLSSYKYLAWFREPETFLRIHTPFSNGLS